MISLGYKATFIAGNQEMKQRLTTIQKLKDFKCKILLTTDLTARGIDAENVNLVINLDIPSDGATYLHRIGRSGRYGSRGTAISVASENELESFKDLLGIIGGKDFYVLKFPSDHTGDVWNDPDESYEKVFATVKEETESENLETEENKLANGVGETNLPNGIEEKNQPNSMKPSPAKAEKVSKKQEKRTNRSELCILREPKKISCEQKVVESRKEKAFEVPSNLTWKDFTVEENKDRNCSKWETANKGSKFNICVPNFNDHFITEDDMRAIMLDLEFEMKTNAKKDKEEKEDEGEEEDKNEDSMELSFKIPTPKTEEMSQILDQLETPKEFSKSLLNFLECLEFEFAEKSEEKSEKSEEETISTDEEIVLNKARDWKAHLQFHIEFCDKLLLQPKYHIKDFGFARLFFDYYSSLKIVLEVQKKALLCIYPEIQNESEIISTYVYSETHTDCNLLEMLKEIEDFKDDHRKTGREFQNHFPYPLKTDSKFPTLRFSNDEIEGYKNALNYLHSRTGFVEEYEKLKETLLGVDQDFLDELEKEIVEEGLDFSQEKILTFVSGWKEKNHDLVCLACKIEKVLENRKDERKEERNIVKEKNVRNVKEKSQKCTVEVSKTKREEKSQGRKSKEREKDFSELRNGYVQTEDFVDVSNGVNNWVPVGENSGYKENNLEENYVELGNGVQENGSYDYSGYDGTNYGMSSNFNCNEIENEEDIESYFENLRIQTDQLHLQLYFSELMNLK